MILRDIMTPISETLITGDTLGRAVILMKQFKINVVPVVTKQDELHGVFTRTSLSDMIISGGQSNDSIDPYVVRDVVTLNDTTPYQEVENLVKQSHVGTGIVIDQHLKPIGLLTKTDMISALFEQTKSLSHMLEQILDSSHLGAIMTDEHSMIIYSNEQAKQFLNKEELDGLCSLGFFPEVENGMVKQVQMEGNHFIVRASNFDRELNQKGYILFMQDVSEVEEMASELKTVQGLKGLLDKAMEHAYDGIVMVNKKGNIQMVSPPLCELFSIDRNKAMRKHVNEVFPQLNLLSVFQSQHAEVSDFLEIKGIKYIVNRIPIVQDSEVIGAIGKVTYRQLDDVKKVFKKLELMENQVDYYKEQLKQKDSSRFRWEQIITRDENMEKLVRTATKAAKGLSTILIRGESGTGKELFAHSIHSSSGRQLKPLVTVNCAAIPEQLLESEFFGYEDGAFTGAAHKGKIGKFDLANGGTLFLDEIGDMSLSLQAKMLRVLQEKEFYRVGGTSRVNVDVRIVAATNQPLEDLVAEGKFREDLYYRLNVISLQIPPLRDRPNDIERLIEHFMESFNSIIGTSVTAIKNDALTYMKSYHWPGNVRELSNVMERAMTFAESGQIQKEDLPEYMLRSIVESRYAQKETRMDYEWEAIEKALAKSSGNKSKAAEILGISRSSLYEKLKKYS
ncbi:sigma 54-interacting transcriptional regulator [Alkalihalobacillus macyae]|uniref:sigma 54-interacting transcriptional regulator n=1 Tax=Guptibacillus hwajinpoensis TaxID=208199 RepID=UPI00273CE863|nr:sigma 54-interacting transcriptional regulator [Alkalihalobacillus macyae]MDP4549421.1 sigma 54-interacting transcriptional regulator [Alkalihalobacillus macyae]